MIKILKRRFIIGATKLDDPAPLMSLDMVHETLSQQYPVLRGTHIFESDANRPVVANFSITKSKFHLLKRRGNYG